MHLNTKVQTTIPDLFYQKPYIKCENCLKTPLKCKNCLLELIKHIKTSKINHPLIKIQPHFKNNPRIYRKAKASALKYSLNDAFDVFGIIPKTSRGKEKEEFPKEIIEHIQSKKLNTLENLEIPNKINEFLPKLPQKVFNHKYLILPEGKRKPMPNIGTGTEIFIRAKEEKKLEHRFKKREKDLFYHSKE